MGSMQTAASTGPSSATPPPQQHAEPLSHEARSADTAEAQADAAADNRRGRAADAVDDRRMSGGTEVLVVKSEMEASVERSEVESALKRAVSELDGVRSELQQRLAELDMVKSELQAVKSELGNAIPPTPHRAVETDNAVESLEPAASPRPGLAAALGYSAVLAPAACGKATSFPSGSNEQHMVEERASQEAGKNKVAEEVELRGGGTRAAEDDGDDQARAQGASTEARMETRMKWTTTGGNKGADDGGNDKSQAQDETNVQPVLWRDVLMLPAKS